VSAEAFLSFLSLPILLFDCFWCHFVLSYSVSSVLFCESARNLTKHYHRHCQRRSWSKATSFFLPSVDSLSSAFHLTFTYAYRYIQYITSVSHTRLKL
jgi:hypothetical protein